MDSYFNWQTTLWALPNAMGVWWSAIWSVLAFVAAMLLFIRTVMSERWSALTFFRSIHIMGLLLIAVSWLNSGWQRWTEPAFAISGCGLAMIYVLDLHRTPGSISAAFWRILVRRLERRPFIRWTIA